MYQADIERIVCECELKYEDAQTRMEVAIADNDAYAVSITRAEWLAWWVVGRCVRAITHPEPYSEDDLRKRFVRAIERIEERNARFVVPEEPGRTQDRILISLAIGQQILAQLRTIEHSIR